MRCSRHITRAAVGYCCICGEFGCEECLTQHEKKYYCARDYEPIAQANAQVKRKTDLKRRQRQRLVAHLLDGSVHRGYSYHLNPEEAGFHLDLCDESGELLGQAHQISFPEMKALYFVKSFDGKFDRHASDSDDGKADKGEETVVQFRDGEIIRGTLQHPLRDGEVRFFLIMTKPEANELSVLIERAAIDGVYTPEEFERKEQADLTAYVRVHARDGVSREEAAGDFHFARHNFHRALRFYQAASEQSPHELRLIKRLISTQYNLGVLHIRHHQFDLALRYMESILRLDPTNDKASKKAVQLRERIGSG